MTDLQSVAFDHWATAPWGKLAPRAGLEPATPGFVNRCAGPIAPAGRVQNWCRQKDSNLPRPRLQRGALPDELCRQKKRTPPEAPSAPPPTGGRADRFGRPCAAAPCKSAPRFQPDTSASRLAWSRLKVLNLRSHAPKARALTTEPNRELTWRNVLDSNQRVAACATTA